MGHGKLEEKLNKEIKRFEEKYKNKLDGKKKELEDKFDREMQHLEDKYKEKLEPFKKVYEKKTRQIQEIIDALAMVEDQIMGERMKTPQGSEELEKKVQVSELEVEKIEKQIKEKKGEVKSLKSSIDEAKSTYGSEENPEKWTELSEKISASGSRIVDGESAISALEMQKFTAEQDVELAKVNLEALRKGVNEKPIEEDPRMKEVLKQKNEIEKYMGRIEKLSAGAK